MISPTLNGQFCYHVLCEQARRHRLKSPLQVGISCLLFSAGPKFTHPGYPYTRVLNIEAKKLSRKGGTSHEASLNPIYSVPKFRLWGTPYVDLFATTENVLGGNFCSCVGKRIC